MLCPVVVLSFSSTASFTATVRVFRQVFAAAGSLLLAKQAHARAIVLGLHRHTLISSALISAYTLLGHPALSLLAFSSSNSNVFLWNSLLASLSYNASHGQVFATFRQMRAALPEPPDSYTFATIAKASAELRDSRSGSAIHSIVIRFGFGSDTVLSNTLMDMYFRCGRRVDARQLFDEIPQRSVASWNALISEHVGVDDAAVWKLVREMQSEGAKPDGFTVSTLLPVCSGGDTTAGMIFGRNIHGYILRNHLRLGSELHVGSCLISMYCKGGNVTTGRHVFDCELKRNVFTWTAMIAGYEENGEFADALRLFGLMNSADGIMPNLVTLVTVLPAIGALASLDDGKQIHGFAFRHCFNTESSLSNALIVMYSKCGSLASARRIFDDASWHKNAISWSSIISCYGIHGIGVEALSLFNRMCSLGIKLDHISSVVVLSACSRAGLVKEGIEIYLSLVGLHGIIPSVEMCSCMVDMLGRAGKLEQALDFINFMPLEPETSVWGALLGAAVTHRNQEIQHLASKFLIQTEPENPSHYVSLSNFHAFCGRWDAVADVRKRMKVKGLRKTPGLSWININGKVHSFYVADMSHTCSGIIYKALDNLSQEIMEAPKFDNITCDSRMI